MVEQTESREQRLRQEYLGQTARIHWHELQTYYAQGSVIRIAEALDLVEVAVQLGLDNTDQFQQWITDGLVSPVTEELAQSWYDSNPQLWTVVAAPWVLVQDK